MESFVGLPTNQLAKVNGAKHYELALYLSLGLYLPRILEMASRGNKMNVCKTLEWTS